MNDHSISSSVSSSTAGRVAVITGVSSGIGKETAKALASQGWSVFGLGRNVERCQQAEHEIAALASNDATVTVFSADLALMSDVECVANEIIARTDRVDVLLNNAGGVTRERIITTEGNENTFASNHLGHFLLVKKLLPLLRRSVQKSSRGSTRIINVSSSAHEVCTGLDWDDLQMMDNFVSIMAYSRVKLANLLFTRELSKQLADEGIVAHAMHPGIVSSNFFNHGDDQLQAYGRSNSDRADSPVQAAETLVWLATAEEPGRSSGGYFYQCQPAECNAMARDDEAARKLWSESERLLAGVLA